MNLNSVKTIVMLVIVIVCDGGGTWLKCCK